MTMTATTIDDTEHQTDVVIESRAPNPEVLERSAGRLSSVEPGVTDHFGR
jgi:hypothetical protein